MTLRKLRGVGKGSWPVPDQGPMPQHCLRHLHEADPFQIVGYPGVKGPLTGRGRTKALVILLLGMVMSALVLGAFIMTQWVLR